MLFLPELTILGAGLILFLLSLGKYGGTTVRTAAVIVASLVLLTCLVCLRQNGELFYGAYRVDLFSQVFKTLIAAATLIVLLFGNSLVGVKSDSQPEYYLFLLPPLSA